MVLAGLLFHVVLFCFTAGPFLAPALHQTLDIIKNTPSLIAQHLPLATLSSTSWHPFATLSAPPTPTTYNLFFVDVTTTPDAAGKPFNDSGYVYHEGFEPIPALSQGIIEALWKGRYGVLLVVALLLDIIVVCSIAKVCVQTWQLYSVG